MPWSVLFITGLWFVAMKILTSARKKKITVQKPCRHLAAPPFAGLSQYMVGQVYLYRQFYTDIRQNH
jgi:hypothetical protein